MTFRRLFDAATIEIRQIPIVNLIQGNNNYVKIGGIYKLAISFIKINGIYQQRTSLVKVNGVYR